MKETPVIFCIDLIEKWFVCCIASKLGSDAHTDSSRMASLAYYMLAKAEFAETEKFRVSRASLISYAAQVTILKYKLSNIVENILKCFFLANFDF